jgi:hypothetical protein
MGRVFRGGDSVWRKKGERGGGLKNEEGLK